MTKTFMTKTFMTKTFMTRIGIGCPCGLLRGGGPNRPILSEAVLGGGIGEVKKMFDLGENQ